MLIINIVIGTIVMDLALIVLAVLSHFSEVKQSTAYGYGGIAAVLVFQLASYNSWMILNYSMPLEILKYTQRAKGIAMAQSISYAFNFISIYTIPIALNTISWRYYVLMASWNVLVLMVVIFYFEETNSESLEQVGIVIDGEATNVCSSNDPQEKAGKTEIVAK
jgi:hypothetical protein